MNKTNERNAKIQGKNLQNLISMPTVFQMHNLAIRDKKHWERS